MGNEMSQYQQALKGFQLELENLAKILFTIIGSPRSGRLREKFVRECETPIARLGQILRTYQIVSKERQILLEIDDYLAYLKATFEDLPPNAEITNTALETLEEIRVMLVESCTWMNENTYTWLQKLRRGLQNVKQQVLKFKHWATVTGSAIAFGALAVLGVPMPSLLSITNN